MAEIGQYDILPINRLATPGAYLDGGNLGEILLPGRYLTPEMEPGKSVEVFLYLDSEDRLTAITERPKLVVGEFGKLRVVSVNRRVGAFLDWGLPKDLLLPFREQHRPVKEGDRVVVYVHLDKRSQRIVASSRLKQWLDQKKSSLREGQQVNLMIAGRTPLGYSTIIEGAYSGLLYADDVPMNLVIGSEIKGYVKAIRSDGKIDLTLFRTRGSRMTSIKRRILAGLEENGGFLALNDSSNPDSIRRQFGTSKKVFKRTLGTLYKERRIRFDKDGIRLIGDAPPRPGKRA